VIKGVPKLAKRPSHLSNVKGALACAVPKDIAGSAKLPHKIIVAVVIHIGDALFDGRQSFSELAFQCGSPFILPLLVGLIGHHILLRYGLLLEKSLSCIANHDSHGS
jgi:hypothetical protein